MKQRASWILVTFFLSGLTALWWAEHARIPTLAEKRRMSIQLLPDLLQIKRAAVSRVEIVRNGGKETVELVRRADLGWQMQRPINVAADRELVETLIRNLIELTKSPDSGTLEDNPKGFDLDPPLARIRLFKADSTEPISSLDVGKTVRDLRSVHVPETQGIELVPSAKLAIVDLPLKHFRDRTLLDFASFQVEKVSIVDRNPARNLKLVRDERKWRMLEPIKAPADPDKVETLIAELGALRVSDEASGFVADDVKPADLSKYGLDPAWMVFEVAPYPKSGRPPLKFSVGNPVPEKPSKVFVMRGDQDDVIEVDIRKLKEVVPNSQALRSPEVLEFEPTEVSKIRMNVGERVFELEKKGERWELLKPLAEVADTASVVKLLKALRALKVGAFLNADEVAEPRLTTPAIRIQIWSNSREVTKPSESEPAVDLKLGRIDRIRKTIYGRLADDPTILAIPDSLLELIPKTAFAYRPLQVLALNPVRISSLTVTLDDKKVTVASPGSKQRLTHWRMVEPVKAKADESAVTNLITQLSNLRAESWETETLDDLKKYGLDSNTVAVEWTFEPAAAESRETPPKPKVVDGRLRVGNQKAGTSTFYASVDGTHGVFTVNVLILEALSRELHDHSILKLEPGDLRRAVLEWPGRQVIVEPRADLVSRSAWRFVEPAEIDPDTRSSIESVLRDLSRLETSRFVQYSGEIEPTTGLSVPNLTIRLYLLRGPRLEETVLRVGKQVGGTPRFVATTSKDASGSTFILSADTAWLDLIRPKWIAEELPNDVFAPLPSVGPSR